MAKRSRSHSCSLSELESQGNSPDDPETTAPPLQRTTVASDSNPVAEVMHCALPPHRETLAFASYEDYEVHYLQAHVNRCSQCSKNFPTAHFLNLHIEENHDPLAAARRERGDKTSYNFYIINDGLDKQTSLLKSMNSDRTRRRISRTSISSVNEGRLRRRSSVSQANPPAASNDVQETQPKPKATDDMEIDSLERSMSALRFLPASVTKNWTKASHSNS
ncbi:hypothetical protein N7478_005786 [Penicillium angulare]|uniref:uncharacterized protein n=1 Tax=Penicillium angulare TaxID=116970 RepID=UPI00254015C7|nr:uncharacterized protein N7478_005786 [Penicillium angulare]KAJ5280414.1 hypothetical protein N7478_005786 [Penicillium angulare]